VQDDPTFLFGNGRISREAGFQRAQQMGATVLRINVIWRTGCATDAAVRRRDHRGGPARDAVHLTLVGPRATRAATGG